MASLSFVCILLRGVCTSQKGGKGDDYKYLAPICVLHMSQGKQSERFEKCKPVQLMLARGKVTFSKSPFSGVSARDLYVHAEYKHTVSRKTKK